MSRWRKLLCFLGLHAPQITRKVFWGNCHRAELHCVCGRRFEAFAVGGSSDVNLGYVVEAPLPSDFWQMYDSGTLPKGAL